MVEDLGLRGVALKVYALIYSFTKAGGSCYGSLNYICERTGASRSAVIRSLQKLIDKGYIYKIEDYSITTNRYVAKMSLTYENNTERNEIGGCQNDTQVDGTGGCQNETGEYQNDTYPVSKRHPTGVKMTPNNKGNNKENNKEITTTTTNIHSFKGEESLRDPFLSAGADKADKEAYCKSDICADKADKTAELAKALDVDGGYISMASIMPDPPPMRFFGQRRVVMMTLHQYVCLLRSLGIHTTLHYIRNLEKCIISRPEAHYKNHYKTILKWAKEDSEFRVQSSEFRVQS